METSRDFLKRTLIELGINVTGKTIADFMRYLQELKRWNRVHNITAITDDHEIVAKHFLDSLLFLKALPDEAKRVCDVGSGGGFPGLPLAMVRPDLEMTLLEPSRKKAAFLKQMRRLLQLKHVEVIDSRIDDLRGRQFDVVLTRATFTISELIQKAGHAVVRDGILILSKGPKYENELSVLDQYIRYDILQVQSTVAALKRYLVTVTLVQEQHQADERSFKK